MKRNIPVFPLILILAVSAIGQTASRANDEEGIKKVSADFEAAWNTHDAKAFARVFAEDADFTNVSGVGASSRAEVEKFHAPRFATTFKDSHLKITGTKTRFIKEDVAVVDARWEMTGAKTREGQDIPLRKGLLIFVMTKNGGKWYITVMHNMNLPDAP